MPQASVFSHGDASPLFSFFALRSKAALFQEEFGAADTTAAFINDYCLLRLILAVISGAGVQQVMNLLLGSAVTSQGKRSMPAFFTLFIKARAPVEPLNSKYELF